MIVLTQYIAYYFIYVICILEECTHPNEDSVFVAICCKSFIAFIASTFCYYEAYQKIREKHFHLTDKIVNNKVTILMYRVISYTLYLIEFIFSTNCRYARLHITGIFFISY